MSTIRIEIAPSVRLVVLAHAVRQTGHELASVDGRIVIRPGRPRMVSGGDRRRGTQ